MTSNHFSVLFKGLGLIALSFSLGACNFLLFDPKGPIGQEQKELIIFSFWIMMLVVIPVMVMTVVFAIRYRASNLKSEYAPQWSHSNAIEAVVWSVPCFIIIILGFLTYKTSHSLDPRQAIISEDQTLRIHVVALDWKWLFIYPDQEVASVNEVALPINRPVEFLITSDSVMNSFFIPQLGSQIYAMAGMENQLHLVAAQEGVYRGLSANYSGFGFSGMKFKAHALSENKFANWIYRVKNAQEPLSEQRYLQLKEKTKDHPVEYFAQVNPLLFNTIIQKYTGLQNGQ